jgi:hypothetical protein
MVSTIGVFIFVIFTCFLGLITTIYVVYYFTQFLYQKYKFNKIFASQITLKFKVIFSLMIILNLWNFYALYIYKKVVAEVHHKAQNSEKRSRFILPVDYKFDQFIFPKYTKINLNNIHDNGGDNRYLTLAGLNAAIFPYPVVIANVKAIAFRKESDNIFLLQLSEDQQISSVYEPASKNAKSERSVQKNPQLCKKDQIAEFSPSDDYYPDTDYSNEHWITLEDETFNPKKWIFKQCYTAPPIHLKAMYPLPLKYNYETMSWY